VVNSLIFSKNEYFHSLSSFGGLIRIAHLKAN